MNVGQFCRLAFLAAASMLVFSHSMPANAQQAAAGANIAVKVAVVDMDAIQQKAKAVKSIRDQIAKYHGTLQTQIQSEEQSLRTAEQELARQRTILSAEAFNVERQKLGQRVQSFGRKVDFLKRELIRIENQSMVEVQNALQKVVTTAANEFKYTLVLRKDQTMLSEAHDVTPMVIERLDKALPSVKVPAPSPEPPADAPAAAATRPGAPAAAGAPRPGTAAPGLTAPAR